MHSTRQPGVSALDLSPNSSLLLTGGRDKQVQIYDMATNKTIATLKGHTKEINQVSFAVATSNLEFGSVSEVIPASAISASVDGSVRIWKSGESSSYALAHTINDFKAAVTGISVHPCGEFFAAASKDGSWCLYDLNSGSRLYQADHSDAANVQDWTSVHIHPDGILMALGAVSGLIRIVDIRTGQESAAFEGEGAITSLDFSENGYYLASATASTVEVWDLRKLVKAGSISIEGEKKTKTVARFDPSGQYLAVVGVDVRIYANKTWELLWSDDASNTAEITDAKWSLKDGALFTASLDRTIRSFTQQAAAS